MRINITYTPLVSISSFRSRGRPAGQRGDSAEPPPAISASVPDRAVFIAHQTRGWRSARKRAVNSERSSWPRLIYALKRACGGSRFEAARRSFGGSFRYAKYRVPWKFGFLFWGVNGQHPLHGSFLLSVRMNGQHRSETTSASRKKESFLFSDLPDQASLAISTFT